MFISISRNLLFFELLLGNSHKLKCSKTRYSLKLASISNIYSWIKGETYNTQFHFVVFLIFPAKKSTYFLHLLRKKKLAYCEFRSRQLKLKYCRTADKFRKHDTMSAIMVIFKCLSMYVVVLHCTLASHNWFRCRA